MDRQDEVRLLYWPQLSMRSYRDNRWLFQKDAQVTKMRAYVEALPPMWHWTWLLPPVEQLDSEWRDGWPDPSTHSVEGRFVSWMDNVLQGRYYFPMREIVELVELEDFDLMLLEVPELARPMRVVQEWTGKRFPIVSMVEHVDIYEQTRVPEQVSYTLRQVDGGIVSDVLAFPLLGMMDEWNKAMYDITDASLWSPVRQKQVVWNAIYSPSEVLTHRADHRPGTKPVVNFISRLSDNQRTHYVEFFDACRLLKSWGHDFDVWVQNPNEAQAEQWCFEQGDFVTVVGNSGRADYIDSLWASDVVPILYPQSHIYSLGYCEAITARNHVITHALPEHDVGATVSIDEVTADSIAVGMRKIFDVLDEPSKGGAALDEQETWLLKKRSVDQNIDRVLSTIAHATLHKEENGVRD